LYVMDNKTLEVVDGIKNLGVYYDSLLLFNKHISGRKVNKAYMMLGIIKRNLEYISKNCSVMLYESLVRSYLKYAIVYGTQKDQLMLISWNECRKEQPN